MAKKDRVRMTVWVEFEHREWLRRQAYERDTTIAQVVHDLIEDAKLQEVKGTGSSCWRTSVRPQR